MNRTLRAGVIGVGSLGRHHARVYAELPGVALAGVYDIKPDRCAEVAGLYGARACSDIDDLAAHVDLASVVVPADKHFQVFEPLARHKLHLLVEKPIATGMEEAEAMVGAAQRNGTVLQVGHVERFNPVMNFLEKHLAHPRFIEATRLSRFPPPRDAEPPRGTEVSVVLDLMIHDLEIILHLVRSPVSEIHAVGVPVLTRHEDIANARLLFANGCVANITASRISREATRKIRVFQEDTYVSLDYGNQSGKLHRKSGTGIEVMDVPLVKGEPLVAELASFVECVRTSGDPMVSGEQASRALKLAMDICRAMRESPS